MARRRQLDTTDTTGTAGTLPAVSVSGELEPRAPPATSTSQALVPANAVSASPLDLPTQVFQAGLDRRKQNRAALMDWIRAALVEGTDYGRVHIVGRDRCSLCQAGGCQELHGVAPLEQAQSFQAGGGENLRDARGHRALPGAGTL